MPHMRPSCDVVIAVLAILLVEAFDCDCRRAEVMAAVLPAALLQRLCAIYKALCKTGENRGCFVAGIQFKSLDAIQAGSCAV